MKTKILTLMLASLLAQSAIADEALAKKNNCFSCHLMAKKLVGPSIQAIADKYKGADDKKINELAQKVRDGGVGVWGQIPMTAHPNLSQADAVKVVKWYLSSAK